MSSQPPAVATRVASDGTTVVGVDLNTKRLLVAAPAGVDPAVENALVVGGGVERDLYGALGDTLSWFDGLAVDTDEAETEAVETYRSLLRQRFGLAAHALLDYADRQDADVVALEDIEYKSGELAACARGQTKAGEWVLPTFRDRLEATLVEEGLRVERVDPAYSTQRCHVCGELADVGRATITCEAPACPVDTVCRDRSAAVTIARRAQALR